VVSLTNNRHSRSALWIDVCDPAKREAFFDGIDPKRSATEPASIADRGVLIGKIEGTSPLSARSCAALLLGCGVTDFRPLRDWGR
jgi:hypothetical protein